MMKIRVSFFIILMGQTLLWGGWHNRKAEGWAWYEKKKLLGEKNTQPESLTSVTQMEQVRKTLEEKLTKAVLEPTPENIKSYMEEQQRWIERSSHFAQVWAQVLLNHPFLDHTATTMPISQYGLVLYRKDLQTQKEQLFASLVKEYGLFFFYEGKNEASVIFGQIVKEFSKKYGWKTIAISTDGVEIEGLNGKKNNGIVRNLGVNITPALYLINAKKNIAIPISFGLVAMDQIEENILLQFKERVRE